MEKINLDGLVMWEDLAAVDLAVRKALVVLIDSKLDTPNGKAFVKAARALLKDIPEAAGCSKEDWKSALLADKQGE